MRLGTETVPGGAGEFTTSDRTLRRTDGLFDRRPGLPVPRRLPSPAKDDRQLSSELRELLNVLGQGQALHHSPQRIAVTGVHSPDEASFLTLSLAMTCAGSGYRVLLIDANFERPIVHRQLELSNSMGLSTLLASPDAPHTFPQATSVPNLAAITIGPACPNWSSLLTREQLFHRLQPLAPSFDYMLVDCGALEPSLVGRISAGADNVIIAVKQHVSSMRELATILETLRGEGVSEPAVLLVE
jgi:Mrp family chromosome partitioning ATPase